MRKDWEVKKLGDICDIQNGFAFKSSLFKEQGLPILRISNIQNDTITLDNIVYFAISDYNINLDRFKVYPGDIVVALSGATTGKIGVNRTDLTFYLNQRVALCRESDVLIKGYLFHYLRSKTIELLSMAGGVAQPNLSTNQIQQLLISVPPLQTQQQIVEEFDCLTSIIEKQKKQLKELDNLAQSIFYDMFGNTIENEKEWNVEKLGDVCKIQNGFAFKSTLFREQGLPILRISNIQNDVITLDNIVYFSKSDYNADLDRFKVYPGNIVIALSGATTGKIGVNRTDLTFYLNQRVALCRETDSIIKGYLFHYLRHCCPKKIS